MYHKIQINKSNKMNKRITLFFAVVFCLIANMATAQVSVTSISQVYTQDFNTLANTGATSSTLPLGWNVIGNTYSIGTGSGTSGAIYSFGATNSTDRALGSLGAGGLPIGLFGCKFTNNTGAAITGLNISYKGEMWRLGSLGSPVDTIYFEYTAAAGIDSVNQSPASWLSASSLDFTTPDTIAPTGARDGNVAPNFRVISGSVTGLNIPNGSSFWIRWQDKNSLGSDDGLAVDSLTVRFTNTVLPACTEPASSVSPVTFTGVSSTSANGSFTGVTADGYLVVVDSSNTAPTITDATTYTVGQAIGTGKVVSNGSSTSFTAAGLVANTIYHAYVYPYNNSGCSGGPNYKTTSVGTDTAKTLVETCPEPTAKPTNLVFTTVNNNTIAGHFNKAVPAPTGGYVVVFSTSSNVAYPLDSVTYAPNDSINFASNKSKVIYVGTDSNFTVSGLISGTRYYFAVVPFNNCGNVPNYLRTTPLRDDTITSGTAPLTDCPQPSGVSLTNIVKLDSTTNSITLKYKIPANADSIMIFAGPTSTVGFVTLHDSVYYGVGSTVPSNGATPPVVYYRGTGAGADSIVTLTGLQANTVYKIFFASFRNTLCLNGPNYSPIANLTIRTATGTDCQNPTGVSNTSILKLDSTATTITVKFTIPANADSVMVLAAPVTTVGSLTIRDSVVYPVGTNITTTGTTPAKVYARGTDSTVVLTGLSPNTVYKIFIATFNNKSCTNGPNYSGLATTTIKTALATGIKTRNTEAEFSVYPNPANGMLFVKFSNLLKEEATLEVIDVLGRKLSLQTVTPGTQIQTIDVSKLSRGTYIMNVTYKGENNVSTFIVE